MPVLVFLVLLYACYWVVRAVLSAFAPPQRAGGPSLAAPRPTPPAEPRTGGSAKGQPGPAAAVASPRMPAWAAEGPRHAAWRRRRPPPHNSEGDVLVLGSPRERGAQLIGSLIGGALVTLTMCLVMLVLNSFREGATDLAALWGWQWWAQYAWLVAVSLAGTWAVLIPSKFWEGRPGDAVLRRFFLMVIGLGLGLLAFWATSWFAVDLTHDSHFMRLVDYHAHRALHPADGWQVAKYYLAAFGTLFLVIRWWRLADPARTARLSLWSLFACVFLAALTADIWGFPQPWLPMAACSMSVAVQLAGSWIHPRDRRWQSPST
jgi:hypothetical protein